MSSKSPPICSDSHSGGTTAPTACEGAGCLYARCAQAITDAHATPLPNTTAPTFAGSSSTCEGAGWASHAAAIGSSQPGQLSPQLSGIQQVAASSDDVAPHFGHVT